MTHPEHGSVVSGLPYDVVSVAGRVPADVADFCGPTAFLCEHAGASYEVVGQGAPDGDGALVHEKDGSGAGRDRRLWAVAREGARFTATHTAAF